jgi:hypothetical protein
MPEKIVRTPIEITLYDPETDEVKQTYSRAFVPWEVLKATIRLIPMLNSDDPSSMSEDLIEEMAGLVAEAFGNRFSAQEASRGCDIGEMLTVLINIMARAEQLMPATPANPTNPVQSQNRKRH